MSKKHAINIILKSGDTDHKQELKKEKCYLKLLTRPLRKIVIR